MIRPDKVWSLRHPGEGRDPVLTWIHLLDPGLRRGDDFRYIRVGAIGQVLYLSGSRNNHDRLFSAGSGQNQIIPMDDFRLIDVAENAFNVGTCMTGDAACVAAAVVGQPASYFDASR